MFKRIDILLSGPICSCDEQNLSWAIGEGPSLFLNCKTCDTKLNVPNSKFVARFVLDKKYPGKTKELTKKKPKSKSENKIIKVDFSKGKE